MNKASRYQSSMLGCCTSECYVVLPFLLELLKEFIILVIIITIYFISILVACSIIYSQYSIGFSIQYKVCSYKVRLFIIYLVVPVVVVVGGNGYKTT
jgi:hypothetical protein